MLCWANAKSEVKIQNPTWRPQPCWFYITDYNLVKYGPILIKFDRQVHNKMPDWAKHRKFKFKIQDGGRRHVNLTKITITRPKMDRFRSSLTDRFIITSSVGDNAKSEVQIQNPRWRPQPCWFYITDYNLVKYGPILKKSDRQIHNSMLYWANAKSEVKIQNPRCRPPPCLLYVNRCNSAKYGPILIKFD